MSFSQILNLLLTCIIFTLGLECRAEDYFGMFGLSPSDNKSSKTSLVLGIGGSEMYFNLSSIFNSEYDSKDFVDTPIPHNSYEDLGEKRIGNTLGLEVGKVFSFAENWPRFYVEGGFFWGRTSRVVRSTVTGWLWSQNSTSVTSPSVGAGIIIGSDSDKFSGGVGYNSVRNLTFYVRRNLK